MPGQGELVLTPTFSWMGLIVLLHGLAGAFIGGFVGFQSVPDTGFGGICVTVTAPCGGLIGLLIGYLVARKIYETRHGSKREAELQPALNAFQRELSQLWAERPGHWVAYHGDQRLALASDRHELTRQCLQQGLGADEFTVFHIEPQEVDRL